MHRLLDWCDDWLCNELTSGASRYALDGTFASISTRTYNHICAIDLEGTLLRSHHFIAGGNLAAVVLERQQIQMEVWAEANAESVRATLAWAFPDVNHRTIVTLNNAAP